MTSQVEWSHDFCLTCDRQIPEGTYCSQACRLAELEKAGRSEASTSTSTSALSSSASSSNSSSHGFYLPPAYNFSAVKAPSPSRGFDVASSPHYYANTNHYFATSPTTTQSQQRSLTPSSSRSSLQSTASQSSSGLSLQAAYQLNGYVRSFDQVRESKRRHTHPHY